MTAEREYITSCFPYLEIFVLNNVFDVSDRNSHLTAGIYYWNDEKFEGMSKTLVFRLKRV